MVTLLISPKPEKVVHYHLLGLRSVSPACRLMPAPSVGEFGRRAAPRFRPPSQVPRPSPPPGLSVGQERGGAVSFQPGKGVGPPRAEFLWLGWRLTRNLREPSRRRMARFINVSFIPLAESECHLAPLPSLTPTWNTSPGGVH